MDYVFLVFYILEFLFTAFDVPLRSCQFYPCSLFFGHCYKFILFLLSLTRFILILRIKDLGGDRGL